MSEWAYRKCQKCGEKIHINFKCKCGGDPWEIGEVKLIKQMTMDELFVEVKHILILSKNGRGTTEQIQKALGCLEELQEQSREMKRKVNELFMKLDRNLDVVK